MQKLLAPLALAATIALGASSAGAAPGNIGARSPSALESARATTGEVVPVRHWRRHWRHGHRWHRHRWHRHYYGYRPYYYYPRYYYPRRYYYPSYYYAPYYYRRPRFSFHIGF
jgi:hypothetical protein